MDLEELVRLSDRDFITFYHGIKLTGDLFSISLNETEKAGGNKLLKKRRPLVVPLSDL